ncbi:iron-containing alcohol dehydrogenase [Pseudarthrobacter sp. fls2-241-R2A-168]|uniref:iron-containing alcohol dehydrogenase n=1 Tax=Pseudarthrobacter sp. fls2-241-R2A-168 TaxID=3040304 RepID=UPI0025524160|nr:iron-containing alcohol dehydrogenase [Pseudarthrobacter sp. fls2-241-R2A-168]
MRLPGNVLFGNGASAAIAETLKEFGQRVFIVVDPFLATTDAFQEVKAAITAGGTATRVYTDIQPELPVDTLTAAARTAAEFEPDVILGYGGGSALDASKLVALLLSYPGPLSNYYGENAVPGPVLPLVAVPTTAGTGSEVTPVAVISDPERELKVGISSPHLVPSAAIVDPQLTFGAPASVTAHSGVDALVHAIESYTAAPFVHDWSKTLPVFVGRNLLSSPYSLEAVRKIGGSLVTAVTTPGDDLARADMAYGSLLAGMAFGATGTHLSHALQYPIGALTKTPHGLGTGMMLPFVLQACAPGIPSELSTIGDALGTGCSGSAEDRAAAAIDAVERICLQIGLPKSLREIGIAREDLPRIAELAASVKRLVSIAPVPADVEFLQRILEAAFEGDRNQLS